MALKKQKKTAEKASAGPKPKLTDEMIDNICTYIENGMNNKDTADLCEIGETTLYRWLREADMRNKDGSLPKDYAQQRKLKQAMNKAKAAFKAVHVQSILRASRKSWQASAWLLERKYPEEYGAVDRAYALNLQKMAEEVQENDGLLDALNAAPLGTEMVGDVPGDLE